MTQIVRQARGFDRLRVEPADCDCLKCLLLGQVFRDSSANLGDLKAMGQAIVKDLPLGRRHNLSDAGETTESRRIEDAIPISLRLRSLITTTRAVRFVTALISNFGLSWAENGEARRQEVRGGRRELAV